MTKRPKDRVGDEMTFSPVVPPRVRGELVRHFSQALAKLSYGGMRLAFEFPAAVGARQSAWPEGAALSEARLRGELRRMVETARALRERARELFEQLPEAASEEIGLGVPRGVYFALTAALHFAFGDGLEDYLSYLEGALAATPESLQADWLELHLSHGLGLLDPQADELLPRLMATLCGEAAGGGNPAAGSGAGDDPG